MQQTVLVFIFLCIVQTDYIIVGQGIAGTLLSYHLLKAGKQVIVFDEYRADTASRVASGVINPVTGRRIVKTWMIDELLPFAEDTYTQMGELLGAELFSNVNMLSFHATEQMRNAWDERICEAEDYLQRVNNPQEYAVWFEFMHGIGITNPCLLIDLKQLLGKWRAYLIGKNMLIEQKFDIQNCEVRENGVTYDDISADKIIFCDGVSGFQTPYFKRLPFALNKGEALIVDIPDLPRENIYKQGISIVPMSEGLFWVGSSFEWDYQNEYPSKSFRDKTEYQLKSWLKLPYTIQDHISSVRPGSIERRPFVGMHPYYKNIGIMNGMGTKGCSLAPCFSAQFARYLTENQPITPEADVARFAKILSV